MITKECMKKLIITYVVTVILGLVTAITSASYLLQNAVDSFTVNKAIDIQLHQISYSVFIDDSIQNIELAESNQLNKLIEENCKSIAFASRTIEEYGTEKGYLYERQLANSVSKAKEKLSNLQLEGKCVGL